MNNINSAKGRGILFITGSIVLSALAQLLMKIGTLGIHGLISTEIVSVYSSLIWISVGLVCYAVSMFLWMAALARYQLSFAYPLLSLSYVLVYIGAAVCPRLNESFTLWKSIAILFIVIGVVLVTWDKKSRG